MRKAKEVTIRVVSNNGGRGLYEVRSLVNDVGDAFTESGDDVEITEKDYEVEAGLPYRSVERRIEVAREEFGWLAPHYEMFARNGRWGTCSGCPLVDGRKFPERCAFTDRYDHHLTVNDLGVQTERCLRKL